MKLFWTILKYFGIGAASLTALYGGFMFFDSMKDDISDIKVIQVEYQATTDTILYMVQTMDKRVLMNENAIGYNSGQVGVLRDSYLTYVKNDSSLTKSEFIEYMDPFLDYIKKNSKSTVFNNQPLPEGFGGKVTLSLSQ